MRRTRESDRRGWLRDKPYEVRETGTTPGAGRTCVSFFTKAFEVISAIITLVITLTIAGLFFAFLS